MRAALFIDKDGTLVKDVPYNADPSRIELHSDVLPGLQRVQEAGYEIIVVSNQPGVALGYFEEQALEGVEQRVREIMWEHGVRLTAFFYCPHHPQAINRLYATPCTCRKPGVGMFFAAAAQHGISLQQSWMVGDILDDVEAGKRAGCRTILVDQGSETEWILSPSPRVPDFIVRTVNAGCDIIVRALREEAVHVLA